MSYNEFSTALRPEARHTSNFKLRLQATLRISARQDINDTPIITVIIVVNIHRALIADFPSRVGAEGTIADSFSTFLSSVTAVGVAGAGASHAALVDAEGPCWVLASRERGGGIAAHVDGG